MNILIDIGHPAHVHLFRHVAKNLERNGLILLQSILKVAYSKRHRCIGAMNEHPDKCLISSLHITTKNLSVYCLR